MTAANCSSGARSPPRGEAARSSTATLVTAAALRDLGARLVDLHGQHEHQALLDPGHASRPPRPVRRPRRGARGVGCERLRRAARRRSRRSTRCAPFRAQRASRLEIADFQLAEIDRAKPWPGEDEELRGASARCSRVPSASAASPRRATTSSTTATRRCSPSWARCGSGSASWPRSTPRFVPVPRGARRHQVAARGPLGLPARLRREHRRVTRSGCRRSRTGWRSRAPERRSTGRRWPTSSRSGRRSRQEQSHAWPRSPIGSTPAEADVGAGCGRLPGQGAQALSSHRGGRPPPGSPAPLSGNSTELAMEQTRFEVRFAAGCRLRRASWTARGIDAGGVLRLAEPRRGSPPAGAHRLGWGDVTSHAGDQEPGIARREPERR